MYNEIVYDFENVYFLCSQIKRYEETRPELFYKVISPEEAWDTDSLGNNIEEKHDENIPFSELVAENKQLKARIAELGTELAACREQSPNAKTSAATKARQGKSLAEWKDAFKDMVPVILQCQKEGPKQRTTPELETMCTRYGVTLDKTKMTFLRECLLECLGTEYVNTTGGPTIQG